MFCVKVFYGSVTDNNLDRIWRIFEDSSKVQRELDWKFYLCTLSPVY
jgi:hypothetical protein